MVSFVNHPASLKFLLICTRWLYCSVKYDCILDHQSHWIEPDKKGTSLNKSQKIKLINAGMLSFCTVSLQGAI